MAFTTRGLRLAKALEKYSQDKPVFFDTMGIFNKIKIVTANEDSFKAKLTIDSSMCNGFQMLHGGYTASLIDVISLYGNLAKSGGRICLTTNINVVYLNPARIGEQIIVEAKTIKDGSLPVGDAVIYKENGRLIAKAVTGFCHSNDELQKLAADIIGFDIFKND